MKMRVARCGSALAFLGVGVSLCSRAWCAPTVTLEKVRQNFPWSNDVAITYSVGGCDSRSFYDYALRFVVAKGSDATNITDAVGAPLVTNTPHATVVWKAPADFASSSTTNVTLTASVLSTPFSGDLSQLWSDFEARDGETLFGSLSGDYKITVADGASVTLRDVSVTNLSSACEWAGLTCLGDATLVLDGVNRISNGHSDYPGVQVPSGHTLTICGGGTLDARSDGNGAGIGGGKGMDAGSVVISPDVARVTATRGTGADCIGAGESGVGGTVSVATGLFDTTVGDMRVIMPPTDLSKVEGDSYLVQTGELLTGSLSEDVQIVISDGAVVTLRDVSITHLSGDGEWAGLTCLGDATLILEGTNVVTAGHDVYPGVFVPTNHVLTISGTGALEATGGQYGAGIGGGYQIGCGDVVIEGGTITATGGDLAAGIGCGYEAVCGDIVIRDGEVSATGGESAPGIGSGPHSQGGDIIVEGGTVSSTGGYCGAGIGTGQSATCGDIVISGGDVSATGGDYGAGIGSGYHNATNGNIIVESGTVVAEGGKSGAGIGSGARSDSGSVSVKEDVQVVATAGENANPIGAGDCGNVDVVDVADTLVQSTEDESVVLRPLVDLAKKTQDCEAADGDLITGALAAEAMITIADGATVTLQDVAITNLSSGSAWAGITCLGDATVVLVGTNFVSAGHDDYSGIYVPTGHTLTVRGEGSLVVSGGKYGAGLGGGRGLDCGGIVIESGAVAAEGGSLGGAGIGAGFGSACEGVAVSNEIARVAAKAGDGAEQIGCGKDGADVAVTLAGGLGDIVLEGVRILRPAVVLSSLRGVYEAKHEDVLVGALVRDVSISVAPGAVVTLQNVTIEKHADNCNCAGITCLGDATIVLRGSNVVRGFDSDYPAIYVPVGSTLTIKGDGSLVAEGGSHGAGIGGGYCVDCGSLVFEGGDITATGGKWAAGIGAGYGSTCDGITFADGVVRIAAKCGEEAEQIGMGGYGLEVGVNVASSLSDAWVGEERIIMPTTILSELETDHVALNGEFIEGDLSDDVRIVISDGATVWFRDAAITNLSSDCAWAGVSCLGDATIFLYGSNYVSAAHDDHPGVYVPSGHTLTVMGDGALTAVGGRRGAGIGGGFGIDCGDVAIEGGDITAVGGEEGGAGIGGGLSADFGDVHVGPGIVQVVAKCGADAEPIGAGKGGLAATVTVAGNLVDEVVGGDRVIRPAIDISGFAGNFLASDGDVLTGTLSSNVKITIADGATVKLKNAVITNIANEAANDWAGITCLGDATIVLEGDNFVRGGLSDYPGIYVPTGHTLTITGAGSLEASSNGYGAGVGGGNCIDCGSIVIAGGTVVAYGGSLSAGIGGGWFASCEGVSIESGIIRVVATAGSEAEAIGKGRQGSEVPVTVAPGLADSTDGDTRVIERVTDLVILPEGDFEVKDGDILSGKTSGAVALTIADGATVTLRDATIVNIEPSLERAGITCLGNATIVLVGTNVVKSGNEDWSGVYVPTGCVLTIRGSGSLDVTGGGRAAGIGGGNGIDCGGIVVAGGDIVAKGGASGGAGIGGGCGSDCDGIAIRSGAVSVVSTSGEGAEQIGAGKGGDDVLLIVDNGLSDELVGDARIIRKPVDLSAVAADFEARNGDVLTGVLAAGVKITIADGATVKLRNAAITNIEDVAGNSWAGITCLGGATIVLEGENFVRGGYREHPGIFVPTGHTLAITGVGALEASSNGYGAGIGGGYGIDCGSIVLKGGSVTAVGGNGAAGIGAGTAGCEGVDIEYGVVKVVAKAGDGAEPIGKGGGSAVVVTLAEGLLDRIDGGVRTIERTVDLSKITAPFYEAQYGDILTGELPDDVSVMIAAGATVTLRDVAIAKLGENCSWAGISCLGDATIVLEGTNVVMAGDDDYSGIYVPTNCTLTIRGDGSLDVRGGTYAAAIGGGYEMECGSIAIEGGDVKATGGSGGGAGIGSGLESGCGDITLSGGSVEAVGGAWAAGIGNGYWSSCGSVEIAYGVTKVVAKAGSDSEPIGASKNGDAVEVAVDNGLSDSTDGDTRLIDHSVDLSKVTRDYVARDGDVLTGELTAEVRIELETGAKVHLRDVVITNLSRNAEWAAIGCLGDATIVLEGSNVVSSGHADYSAVFVADECTLTIKGDGALDASSLKTGATAAAIGACKGRPCGNIVISGGFVKATGTGNGAGIGGALYTDCGDITITGGTVWAKGGSGGGAAIGGGVSVSRCSGITITKGVTEVVATSGRSGVPAIGAGYLGSCSYISIEENANVTQN